MGNLIVAYATLNEGGDYMSLEKPTSPYTTMDETQLKEHFVQLSSIIKDKNMSDLNIAELFGITPITAEQTKQLEMMDKFGDKLESIQKLIKEPPQSVNTDLSDNETRLASTALNGMITTVRSINPDIPLDGILNSELNPFDKMAAIDGLKPIIDHYETTVSNLKKQIPDAGTDTKVVADKFGSTDTSNDKYTSMYDRIDKFRGKADK